MAELIAYALIAEGYQTIMAFNMEDALEHFQAGKFAAVILDIFMTGMGGIEGIRRIRDIDPEVRIVAISGGYADLSPDQTLAAAKKIGVEAVLPKPFATEQLLQAMES
jgi:DNA-binding response OmpR family regulator